MMAKLIIAAYPICLVAYPFLALLTLIAYLKGWGQ